MDFSSNAKSCNIHEFLLVIGTVRISTGNNISRLRYFSILHLCTGYDQSIFFFKNKKLLFSCSKKPTRTQILHWLDLLEYSYIKIISKSPTWYWKGLKCWNLISRKWKCKVLKLYRKRWPKKEQVSKKYRPLGSFGTVCFRWIIHFWYQYFCIFWAITRVYM